MASPVQEFAEGFQRGLEMAPGVIIVILGALLLPIILAGGLMFFATLSLLTYCIRNPGDVLFIIAAIVVALILSGGLHVSPL